MTYKLSSGRRYLNGELVAPPQLGPWRESDLFPELLWDDLVAAGLRELEFEGDDDWEQMDEWLLSLETGEISLAFLIERCCDNGWLLEQDLIATRLKEFPLHWQQACMYEANCRRARICGRSVDFGCCEGSADRSREAAGNANCFRGEALHTHIFSARVIDKN